MLRLRLCLLAALLWLPQVQAAGQAGRTGAAGQNGLPVIAVAELPAEARDTLRVIKQGGPFSYGRDGAVFMNYERALPSQSRGYYREYTVKTPGARNRGARRIVCGPPPEGNSGKGSERDEAQGLRSFAWPIDYGWQKTPAESLVSGATEKTSKASFGGDSPSGYVGTTYHEGGQESEHRTTQRFARAATLTEFPECYYTADHYQSFKRIREQP